MSNSPELSLSQILQDAQNRWLRPLEVCEILKNHIKFKLEQEPPQLPGGGSIFLFDRKALRYFRKDGHKWRKKKDGKTVREAHERLKAGSKEVLHCYYAHGEDNESFQRRSYWMLDRELEHIVFVHYRDVKEPNRMRAMHSSNGYLSARTSSPQASISSFSQDFNLSPSPNMSDEASPLPLQSDGCESNDDAEHSFSSHSELHGTDASLYLGYNTNGETQLDGAGLSASPIEKSETAPYCEVLDGNHVNHRESIVTNDFDQARWTESYRQIRDLEATMGPLESERQVNFLHGGNTILEASSQLENHSQYERLNDAVQREAPMESTQLLVDSLFLGGDTLGQSNTKFGFNGASSNQALDLCIGSKGPQFNFPQEYPHHLEVKQQEASQQLDASIGQSESLQAANAHYNSSKDSLMYSHVFRDFQADSVYQQEEQERLKKIDSFGRWITQEIGASGDGSLLAVSSETTMSWPANNEAPQAMQLDIGLSLSVHKEKLFSIVDFTPDHAFSDKETKVLVIGTLFNTGKDMARCKWSCMFGDVEVPAEFIFPGVLRSKAPPHGPGKVAFYVKCDRICCSEVREFVYSKDSSMVEDNVFQQNKLDMLLQVRLAWLLLKIACTEPARTALNAAKDKVEVEWMQLEESCNGHSFLSVKDQLVQKLLREKVRSLHESDALQGGGSVLDTHGLGILHMGAALGYDWIISPLLSTGINIDFRDARGWTALHWAAHCGREKTVTTLVAACANPGAKTDPTSDFPAGQTPADLAASCKHKGIAGYLAEASLTSHLSSLNMQDGKMDNFSIAVGDQRAIQTASERMSINISAGMCEDELSMQDSLAAVRNATQAAARIQATFRAFSFCKRQELGQEEEDEYGISTGQMQSILAAKKHYKTFRSSSDDLQLAATHIQKKYRGYKGRKDFLFFRKNVVTIQAHVRGHQVRKQYKHILWSVGILEKAILRWRRRGRGLRGLSKEMPSTVASNSDEDEDFLKAGRKQTEVGVVKALARVQSMIKHPEARDQYRRLLDGFQKAKKDEEDLCPE